MMKAAVLYGPGDIRVEQVNVPSIEDNEILVKVKAAGICGTDLHTYKTGVLAALQKPSILGHEFSGEIVEAGSKVKGFRVGDAVLGTGYRFCGKCRWCQQGRMDKCPDFGLPGWGMDGAFAEYVVVPNPLEGITTFRLSDGLSFEEAATVEPVSVASFTVDQADLQPKNNVVVMGAGIIGQCIAQIAKVKGAARVIVCEPSEKRLKMAGKMGADVTINPAEADPVKAVESATSQNMAQVVFECSGAPAAFYQALQLLSGHGKLMQVAVFEKEITFQPDLMSMMTFSNLTLRGCGGQNWAGAFELVRTGQVKTNALITHEFSLDDAQEAFKIQADAGASIKVLVKP